jgi:enoyl-CoA hydratase/carnithine racemase
MISITRRASRACAAGVGQYSTISFEKVGGVASVVLSRPEKMNAMNQKMFEELIDVFREIEGDSSVRAAVLSGEGRIFCSGLDLAEFSSMLPDVEEQRQKIFLRRHIRWLQDAISAPEKCGKPVLAAVHGAAIGGAVDLLTSCDMRYTTADAYICIKEVDMGLAADIGTLQRLPKIVGNEGWVREICYTARNVGSEEMQHQGFSQQPVYESKEEMMEGVHKIAETIASKSPVAVHGTKELLLHSRNNTVDAGLDYTATWSASVLMGQDLQRAVKASMTKTEATFDNLPLN